MDKQEVKALKKYLYPSKQNFIIVAFTMLLLIITIIHIESPNYLALFLLILLMIGLCYNEILQIYKLNAFLKANRHDPCMRDILHDFKSGIIIGSDCLRLGEKYIIGHQGITPIRYDDVLRVYEYVNQCESTKSIPRRYLYATTRLGERRLARMPYPRLPKDEFLRFFLIAVGKNPRIRWVAMKRNFWGFNPTYETIM